MTFVVNATATASGCSNCVFTWTITDISGATFTFPNTSATLNQATFPQTINPTGATLSVSVSELGGCPSIPSYFILTKPCCAGNSVIVIGNPLVCETVIAAGDPILTQMSSNAQKRFMVYGDVRITAPNININNCQFTFNNRNSMILENATTTIRNTKFKPCDFLWGGIEVRNGSIDMRNSQVYRSFSGLKVINASINLNNNTFEENHLHVEARNCSTSANLNNNRFMCLFNIDRFIGQVNSCLLNNSGGGLRTLNAVSFNSCAPVTMTDNVIRGATIGVNSTNTSLTISGGTINQITAYGIFASKNFDIRNSVMLNLNVYGVNFNRIGVCV